MIYSENSKTFKGLLAEKGRVVYCMSADEVLVGSEFGNYTIPRKISGKCIDYSVESL